DQPGQHRCWKSFEVDPESPLSRLFEGQEKKKAAVSRLSKRAHHYFADDLAFCTALTNVCASGFVLCALPVRMSLNETSWLYHSRVAFSSCDSSAPFKEAPINAPLLAE